MAWSRPATSPSATSTRCWRSTPRTGPPGQPRLASSNLAADLPTNLLDFGGFDLSIILILRGGILRSIGSFPEVLSQQILVGILLVGRLGEGGLTPPRHPSTRSAPPGVGEPWLPLTGPISVPASGAACTLVTSSVVTTTLHFAVSIQAGPAHPREQRDRSPTRRGRRWRRRAWRPAPDCRRKPGTCATGVSCRGESG